MKVDSVLERIKMWAERGIAQEIILHVSRDGECDVHRKTIIKDENQLDKEFPSVEWHEIA